MHSASRFHDISCGHRVVGHEGKCRFLHGHNYRIHFTCVARGNSLDNLGRVIDFGIIKQKLCVWLEINWDHKTLLWSEDEYIKQLYMAGIDKDIVTVPFNPTAENIAAWLATVVGPEQLKGTGVLLSKVVVEETRRCLATYEVDIQ
jgi:6-pyruvoyltetrahydropterin/6-carboxytetrahydropterin synthase